MNKLSETEIIKIISDDIIGYQVGYEEYEEAVKGLLDLYKQEKEKNEKLLNEEAEVRISVSAQNQINELQQELFLYKTYTKQENLKDFDIFMKQNYISKDKLKAKIEESKSKYNEIHSKHYRDCGIAEAQEKAKISVLQELLEK